MELGLDCSQHHQTWDEILARVRLAEESGFDGAWVFDHFKPLYANPKGPCFEGWTLLAALAAATDRIRLGTLVTGITYRHPSILAAEAVTIDHVSNGRLELALGAAWFEREHRELGIDFPGARERIERLEEAVAVIRALMTSEDATFDGRYYRLEGATYGPRPVQQPHPPIWIGGGGEKRLIPLAGRVADVWHAFGDIATLRRKSAILDEHAEKADRDPTTIRRSTSLSLSQSWDQVRSTAAELRAAGFSYLTVGWPSEGREHFDEFVADVMPEIAAA